MLFSVYKICFIQFKCGFKYNIIKSNQNILSVKKYKDKQCNGWLILIHNIYTYKLLIYNFNGSIYLRRIFSKIILFYRFVSYFELV